MIRIEDIKIKTLSMLKVIQINKVEIKILSANKSSNAPYSVDVLFLLAK